ncbi:MAG: alpha/beta fold hydrolase [Bradymonadaceae bacterium]
MEKAVFPPTCPVSTLWQTRLDAPFDRGVRVTGEYHRRRGAQTLVVIVHGLGGCAESPYVVEAAAGVRRAGFSSLRLNMRGAEHSGEDIYHGGLTQELHAVFEDEAFQRYERIAVLGFSLGGHIALRAATEPIDDRVVGVAAVCSPVDLGGVQRWIDGTGRFVYREYVLRALGEAYGAVARRGRAPTALARVRAAKSLREWDRLTVVPRFGFDSVSDYYRRASVADRLADLQCPGLLVLAADDPMIPVDRVVGAIPEDADELRTIVADRGGHVFFPSSLDLGLARRMGLVPQVAGWLNDRCPE